MFASFAEYLKARVRKPFNPRPRYFPIGDYLTCFVNERRCWSRRINEWLTLYEDIETGEVVGVKVKGLQAAGIVKPNTDKPVIGLLPEITKTPT